MSVNLLDDPSQEAPTLADVLDRLGVSPERIRFLQPLGLATEQDVLDIHDHEGRLFELVEGILVEKAMGFRESYLTSSLIYLINRFVVPRNLGLVAAPDGMMQLSVGLVRMPDVSFVAWDRLPGRCVPSEPIVKLAPNLAVEVLSVGNTRKEMSRKRREYFESGVLLYWEVNPELRTVAVYTSATAPPIVLTAEQTLDGGDVLPGFTLPLSELFAELDRHA